MSSDAEWLAGLKVGDPVVMRSWFPKIKRVDWIARFTKTLIVTDTGQRFQRTDGRTPGNSVWHSWNFHWIEKPTAAQARKAER